jgi:hypothetical protein
MPQDTYNKSEYKRFLKRTLKGLGKAYYGNHISGKMMVELSGKFTRMLNSLK